MGKKNKSSSNGNNSSSDAQPEVIPDEFKKVISDFISDISTTFPEYSEKLEKNFTTTTSENDGTVLINRTISDEKMIALYEYSKKVYPSRFFDILYKNNDLFKKENKNELIDTCFLPDIEFRELWNTPDISDNTRDTIWKYLQLILFSIITNISDRNSFGDTAKLFEAINENELKDKLEETFKNMHDLFMGGGGESGEEKGEHTENGGAGDAGENDKFPGINMKDFEQFAEQFKNFSPENMDMGNIDMSKFPGFNFTNPGGADAGTNTNTNTNTNTDPKKQPEIPNPEAVHDHISKLLNGKIGALAKEIAEETAGDLDLGIDMENPEKLNMGNVFQKLFKNPGKLMNMVKNVGKKLDDKFKNGDIKESEIMQEASDLLSNMKNMPGMGNLSSMLNQLGMSGLGGLGGLGGKGGKGGKINIGALQNHLQQNMKQAKMKERMHTKLQQRQQQQQQPQQQQQQQQQQQPQQPHVRSTTSVYTTGEQIQQTPRTTKPPAQSSQECSNVVISTPSENNTTMDDGYTPTLDAQKKKKKKNKK